MTTDDEQFREDMEEHLRSVLLLHEDYMIAQGEIARLERQWRAS